MAIIKQPFENADLVNYEYTWVHNLNTTNIEVHWFDGAGNDRNSPDVIQVIDANIVLVKCNGDIAGPNYLIAAYDDSQTFVGKRLFELTEDTTPDTTMRLAIGKANAASKNITISSFLTYLLNNLGFLKAASNLADLTNVAAAQSALQVYSRVVVDGFLSTKATLFGTGPALGNTNTVAYTPVADYNPATKKYADDLVKISAAAAVDVTGQDPGISLFTYGSNARTSFLYQLNGAFKISSVVNTKLLLGQLDTAPTADLYFPAAISPSNQTEGGYILVDTDGKVWGYAGKLNQTYIFHVSFFHA